MRFRYANFIFPHFWKINSVLFPFRYPINPETLILGRILTNICMWSGHTSPSIISTPFHWHNCLNISLIAWRFSSKNTFRLYFGANTMWYLQFHFVCARLFVFIFSFFKDKSSSCVFCGWQTTFILPHEEDFFSPVNLSWTTRLSRGFHYTRKSARLYSSRALLIGSRGDNLRLIR